MKQGDIVYQTAAQIANWLKALIDGGHCEVKKYESSIDFYLMKGSASIAIEVMEHPRLEDEALVSIKGSLVTLPESGWDPRFAVEMLKLNSELAGFAVCLQPENNMLLLRGALIGSTMDQLEFSYLLQALSGTADDLDDKIAEALGLVSKPPKPPFEELIGVVVNALDNLQSDVLNGFYKDLGADQRAEFDELLKSEEFVEAVKTIVLGKPAGMVAAAILSSELSDDQAKEIVSAVFAKVPEHKLFVELFSYAVFAAAKALSKALEIEPEALAKRVKKLFG